MRLKLLLFILIALAGSAFAQSSCPAPTPGSPHVCLKWTASTTRRSVVLTAGSRRAVDVVGHAAECSGTSATCCPDKRPAHD